MNTKNDCNNALLIHLSAFAGYFFPFGSIVAPLVIWQIKKDESTFLDEHGKAAINFNLSYLLYTLIIGFSFIPMFTRSIFNLITHGGDLDLLDFGYHFEGFNFFGLFGIASILSVMGIIKVVLIIHAALKAQRGEDYTYPLTIKFIK